MTYEDSRRAIILIEELAEELEVMRVKHGGSSFGESILIMAKDFLKEVTDEAY